MKKLLIILLISISVFPVAEAAVNTDSLESVYNNKKISDSLRYDALGKLISVVMRIDINKAEEYVDMGIKDAVSTHNSFWIGNLWIQRVVCIRHKGDFPRLLSNIRRAEKIIDSLKVDKLRISIYNNYGIYYSLTGDSENSLKYFLQFLKEAERLKNDKFIATANNNIGNIYISQERYEDALKYYTIALNIREKLEREEDLASSCVNMGLVNYHLKNFDIAGKYYFKALKIWEKLGATAEMSNTYNHIASYYLKMLNFEKSIEYQTKALKIQEEQDDKLGQYYSLSGISHVYVKMKKYDDAEKWLKKAESIIYEIGAKYEMAEVNFALSELNELKGNYNIALKYYKKSRELKDSIMNTENSENIEKLKLTFDTEKKDLQISELNKDKKIKELQLGKNEADIKRQKILIYFSIAGILIVLVFMGVIYNNYLQKKKTSELIALQKQIVEEKNHEITQSIQYAQKIQNALLPNEEVFKSTQNNSFILFKPKDIVSGDFYWLSDKEKYVFYATADCTGHGVPGGFMSMLGTALLNEIVDERKVEDCGEVLTLMREKIMQALKQAGDSESKDGMDMVLIRIDKNTLEMQYAAANNSMYIVGNKQSTISNEYCVLQTADCQLFELPCDKMPVGVYHGEVKPFNTHTCRLYKGDIIYTYTDGFADQFGGDKGKKYTYKRLREKLLAICNEPMEKQKTILQTEFEQWQGKNEQIDDVCVIGVKI